MHNSIFAPDFLATFSLADFAIEQSRLIGKPVTMGRDQTLEHDLFDCGANFCDDSASSRLDAPSRLIFWEDQEWCVIVEG